jgi:hypothetical protein
MTVAYEKRSKDELLEVAAAQNIEGRSSMSKDELVVALRGDQPPEYPDTPSGKALAKVGNIDGEAVDHHKEGETEKALEHGEAYQAEKRKHRWG